MHWLCLVVGDAPERQLEPFSKWREVPPYRQFLDDEEIELMASRYGLAATDLDSLAGRMKEWAESEGGIHDGKLYFWTTANPEGRWDWYKMGGSYSGYLELKAPRPAGFLERLFKRPAVRVDQARRYEIREERLLDDPPAALLMAEQWHEAPLLIRPGKEELDSWARRFRELFLPLPQDSLLTVMDTHS